MLKVEKLSVHYGKMPAVRELDFEVNAGEFVTILGANGAGKTTTLSALMGILPAHSGRIIFQGKDITTMPTPARVRAGLSLVPEGRQMFPGLSVADNLKLAYSVAHPGRRSGSAYSVVLERIVSLFPWLPDRMAQWAGSLSGGEQQMVALARGLLAEPKVLLLDEPSLGLAPLIIDQVLDVITRLNKEGLTVIMVEQDANRALEVTERAYILETGRLTLSGRSADLLASPVVQAAFLGG